MKELRKPFRGSNIGDKTFSHSFNNYLLKVYYVTELVVKSRDIKFINTVPVLTLNISV